LAELKTNQLKKLVRI